VQPFSFPPGVTRMQRAAGAQEAAAAKQSRSSVVAMPIHAPRSGVFMLRGAALCRRRRASPSRPVPGDVESAPPTALSSPDFLPFAPFCCRRRPPRAVFRLFPILQRQEYEPQRLAAPAALPPARHACARQLRSQQRCRRPARPSAPDAPVAARNAPPAAPATAPNASRLRSTPQTPRDNIGLPQMC